MVKLYKNSCFFVPQEIKGSVHLFFEERMKKYEENKGFREIVPQEIKGG